MALLVSGWRCLSRNRYGLFATESMSEMGVGIDMVRLRCLRTCTTHFTCGRKFAVAHFRRRDFISRGANEDYLRYRFYTLILELDTISA